MAKKTGKIIVIKSERKRSMRIFEAVFGVAAYCVLYFMLISALPYNPAYYAVVPFGVAVCACTLLFFDNKKVRYAILGGVGLFVALVLAAGFGTFRNGLLRFMNAAIEKANAAKRSGYEYYDVSGGFGSDFLFLSVASVASAAIAAFSVKHACVFICLSATYTFALLFLGLYPHYMMVVLIALVYVCLLANYNGFTFRAAWCYVLCSVAALGALIPCCLFPGSSALTRFERSVTVAIEDVLYGASLPNGRLADAQGMRGSDKVRLKVTMSQMTPTLYLKGFVGGAFDGSAWSATDKNRYVENGYQGLLDYVSAAGLPLMQYAEYSRLSRPENKYSLKVENVSADRRYMYAPYTLSEYRTGKAYYDLGLRGSVLTRSYAYTVFAADESSERVTQEDWVTEAINRTVEMNGYIELEGQYRAFVYDTYLDLDDATKAAVNGVIGEFDTNSINTATQFIRAYFLDAFTYDDDCDEITDRFGTQFFGGEIERANAAYFATAATCMFRAMGFAARYAEGYLVRADASDIIDDALTASVTGDNTHAWTEVYFDGIGWLPIEVTPTFFAERNPDVTIDPENPGNTDTAPQRPDVDPTTPDDDPTEPEDPPIEKPPAEEEPERVRLLIALKALVPITSVLLAFALICLAISVRKRVIIAKRRKQLDSDGEEFVRATYSILRRICKRFGGFDRKTLEKYGIPDDATDKFVRVTERLVYGGHALKPEERKFMLLYINKVQEALVTQSSSWQKLYCRYVLCIG